MKTFMTLMIFCLSVSSYAQDKSGRGSFQDFKSRYSQSEANGKAYSDFESEREFRGKSFAELESKMAKLERFQGKEKSYRNRHAEFITAGIHKVIGDRGAKLDRDATNNIFGFSVLNQGYMLDHSTSESGEQRKDRLNYSFQGRSGYTKFNAPGKTEGEHFFGDYRGTVKGIYQPSEKSPGYFGYNHRHRVGVNFIDQRPGKENGSIDALIEGGVSAGVIFELGDSADSFDYINIGACADIRGTYFAEDGVNFDQYIGAEFGYVCEIDRNQRDSFFAIQGRILESMTDEIRDTICEVEASWRTSRVGTRIRLTNDNEWFGTDDPDKFTLVIDLEFLICGKKH